MSKTFKSAVTNRTLTVEGFFNGAFSVVFSDDSSRDLMLQGDDAPALALAILEAAGTPMNLDVSLGKALYHLDAHVTLQAKATAEAKEQAELEAEALDFYEAATDSTGTKFEFLSNSTQQVWMKVARKAREMRTEK